MMTTPERLRRRQYEIGLVVLLLGVLTVVWGIALESQNHAQRDCLQTSLGQLNNAFTVRAALNDQRNQIVSEKTSLLDQEVAAQHDLIKAVSKATTQADVTKAFNRFNRTDAHLTVESRGITKRLATVTTEIAKTKVPDFPAGKCN
jgi:hypothetical protein